MLFARPPIGEARGHARPVGPVCANGLVWRASLRRQPSGAHDDRVRRLVTLRATAAIGAVALIASCTAQVTHAARKPAISPANGGIPPNITITPGSQIPPVSMPRMQPGLPAAIRLVTSDKHRFLALPSGRIKPVRQQHGNGQMLPPAGAFWVDARPTWVRVAGGHVEFGQGQTVVWRSRGTYNIATANSLWSDAYSPAGAAFQIGRRGPLYVAPSGGAERRVALGESADQYMRSPQFLAMRNLAHAREGSGRVRDTPSRRERLARADARHRPHDGRDRREGRCRQQRAVPRARHDLAYRWSRRSGDCEPVLAWVHLPGAQSLRDRGRPGGGAWARLA